MKYESINKSSKIIEKEYINEFINKKWILKYGFKNE